MIRSQKTRQIHRTLGFEPLEERRALERSAGKAAARLGAFNHHG